jgi:Cu2+-exporting ATPase/Cu+-exporting ATPase
LIRFYVDGISCSRCVQKLESLPQAKSQIRSVQVQLGSKIAQVEIDPSSSFEAAAQLIRDLGFQLTPLRARSKSDELEKTSTRNELIRLAVAAFCAGNIMTFAFGVYFGLEGDLKQVFDWLSFLLYLPVVTYVAWPFYRGAFQSLKQRQLSIDLPMVVASFSGFLFSTVNLVRGEGSLYFDSIAGFLFLILAARFLQKSIQKKAFSDSFRHWLPLQEKVMKLGESKGWVPVESLKVGDRISLQTSEICPGDARLESESCDFDLSFLTGESIPRSYSRGMSVPSGARVLSSEAVLSIERLGEDTTFGRILSEVRSGFLKQSHFMGLADRASHILILSVFSLAAVFVFLYGFIDLPQALERGLALIVLACPCAMAFGTPLALTMGLRSATTKGLIAKNADVFEKMDKVRTIFLDKTGTLTKSKLEISGTRPEALDPKVRAYVLALESISTHPIAFALRNYLSSTEPKSETGSLQKMHIADHHEVPGVGVFGRIDGVSYSVRRGLESFSRSVALYREDSCVCHFLISEDLEDNSFEVLQKWKEMGLEVYVLSGDQQKIVDRVAARLGLDKSKAFGNLSPEQKAAKVAETPFSMMVGDGINDVLAFQKAFVSVAVSGSVRTAMQSASVYCLTGSLSQVDLLFQISRTSLKNVKRNLWISVVYNSLGAVAALLGFVNPFVAAVLMPISSLVILGSTLWGGRE